MKDVAALAGVSPKTVSNVVTGTFAVSGETRARVERAMQQLDFVPNLSARGMRTGRSGTIAVALPDLATLLDQDKNLRVVLKEFPILSKESVDAARIAVLVNEKKPADYWAFHQALFTSRGQVNADTALDAAQKLGLSRVDLELRSGEPEVAAVIQKSYELAKKLNVTGTPTYIIGDEIIQGAIGLDELKSRIENKLELGLNTATAAP